MVTTQERHRHRAGRHRRRPGPTPSRRFHQRRRFSQAARSPTLMQMEAAECGAASLAMVLATYKKYVPLEELRIACGVSRDGSKASNVLKAARQYGMTGRGVQLGSTDLHKLSAPAVLFWEFNHFVVYDGVRTRFGRQKVHINDPAQGRRVLAMDDFDTSFTGVALELKPGPDFRRDGRKPGVGGGLLNRLRGITGFLLIVLLAGLLLVAVEAAMPAFTRVYVDTVLFGEDRSVLTPLAVLMGATIGLAMALTALGQSSLLEAWILSSTRSSALFFRHLLRLPVTFFAQRNPADLSQRLESNDAVAQMLTRTLSTLSVNLVVAVLYALMLWTYDPQLTAIGLTIAMLNVVAFHVVTRLRANGVTKLNADSARLISTSHSGVHQIETMKAAGAENGHFSRWAGEHAITLHGQQRLGVPIAALGVVPPTLAAVNSALILLLGGMRAIDGAMSIGLLLVFQSLMTNLADPVTELTWTAARVQDFTAALVRLRDVEAFPPDAVYQQPEPKGARQLAGYLSLDNVTFGYNRFDEPVLRDFSLRLGPGQQVALVGGSGSGKSTVSRLVSGLFQPWSGEIRIDGQPRDQLPRLALTDSVAFVDQDIFLFQGSVRDNVTLWDPSISDDEVIAALKDALMYDVVAARPGGIHSTVAQDGRNFSGGQRQRLEIARAIVRNPSILVLDEATSALDADTERIISDNLRRRGCACLVIAHRLSTVRDSDEIIVLELGTVVERGHHDDLVHAGGVYADLVREH
ncbi:NHLP family bacteriocin export ABC transporter peptidase/permease/ATPase subunit [Streptomyces caniscabiei]|uniref:NHLP family bacteriocin export ABC transporter peptidase/permease/ATPase subunit n=2 Tax=Streptomyces TaxID=1883 RepID=UPI0038F820C4